MAIFGANRILAFRLRSSFYPYVVTSLLLCFVSVSTFAQQPSIRFVRSPEPAPAFKLTGLDGKPVTLEDVRGKVAMVNFWATWCGPCRAEIPDLVELQNKYKDRFQILSLVVDEDDLEALKRFVEKSPINFPVAVSTDEIRMQYGGIAALPTSFLLDTQGRVVQKHEGLRDPILYEVEIRALLGLPIGNIRVETFEDTGQIFIQHANRATELPGIDLSKLTAEQKTAALHKFNAQMCTCGCQYTLAQCRIYDRGCNVSKAAIGKIIAALVPASPQGPGPAAAPASATPAPGATSSPSAGSAGTPVPAPPPAPPKNK